MHRAAAALSLLIVLSVPAAGASAWIGSQHAATLDGTLSLDFPGGVASAVQSVDDFDAEFLNVTGEGILYTWQAAGVLAFSEPIEEYDETPYQLHGARLALHAESETISVGVIADDDGSVGVAGGSPEAASRPDWLAAEWRRTNARVPGYPLALPRLDIVAPAGWGASATLLNDAHDPVPTGPELRVAGSVLIEVVGGDLTIFQADGSSEVLELRTVAEGGAGAASIERHAMFVLTAVVERGDVPLEDGWIVAGPRPSWTLSGTADWPKAAGAEADVPFKDVPVHVEGDFALSPDPSQRGPLEADRFVVSGDYTLTAGGVLLTPEAPVASSTIAAWTLAGALATLLAFLGSPHLAGRVIAPFYTRISRDDIATHPARSQICEHLTGTPGVHLRDLHRRIGGAWGTFSFHLGMLRQAGVIRFEREGRYVAVYLAHQEIARAGPRTVTAQKVLEALPHDGSPMPVTKLRERVGLSRQLLDHHLAALSERELVVVDHARPRRVSRK